MILRRWKTGFPGLRVKWRQNATNSVNLRELLNEQEQTQHMLDERNGTLGLFKRPGREDRPAIEPGDSWINGENFPDMQGRISGAGIILVSCFC